METLGTCAMRSGGETAMGSAVGISTGPRLGSVGISTGPRQGGISLIAGLLAF